MKRIKEKKLLEFQEKLKLYLQQYRDNENLSRAQLAKKLDCSVPNIEKLMSSTTVSSPIKALKTLIELSSLDQLQGFTPSRFVLMLMGELNESNERDTYTEELYSLLLDNLDDNSKMCLKRAIKNNPERISSLTETLDDIASSKTSQVKVELYKKIKSLTNEEAQGISILISKFKK